MKPLKYIDQKLFEMYIIIIENVIIILLTFFRNVKTIKLYLLFFVIEFLYDGEESREFDNLLCLYILNQEYNKYKDYFLYWNKTAVIFVKQVFKMF